MPTKTKKRRRLLEKNKRLSESVIWKLQEELYTSLGPKAWSVAKVPFYVTSNPLIASQYVELTLAFIRDGINGAYDLDLKSPITIIEIGTGSGRFSYLFLKMLQKRIKNLFPDVKINYILTDMAPKNLDFWKKHPYFQTSLENGTLDTARFLCKDPLTQLTTSRGQTFDKGSLKNPPIIVANYIFDTIPQDCFRMKHGDLEEGLITVKANKKWEGDDPNVPDVLPYIQNKYAFQTTSPKEAYPNNPLWQTLLKYYIQTLPSADIIFPSGPLKVIETLKDLSTQGMMLLASDQGVATVKQMLRFHSPPVLAKHTSFSLSVNYHAIGRFFHELKGKALLPSTPSLRFITFCGLLGNDSFHTVEDAFEQTINHLEMREYLSLANNVFDQVKKLRFEDIISLIRLGRFDPINFCHYAKPLFEMIPKLNPEQKQVLLFIAKRAEENFFPICHNDLTYIKLFGSIVMRLGDYVGGAHLMQKADKLAKLPIFS